MSEHAATPIHHVSLHVIFSGQVQGVGFRYTAVRLATGLGLAGWVRNLSDGRVELCVEGTRALCQELVERLKRQFAADDVDASEGPVSGVLTSFDVKY